MPEIFEGDDYMDELRMLIKKVLIFFCDKIENAPTRKKDEIPNYIQLGVDFEQEKNVDEMLDMIGSFLLT